MKLNCCCPAKEAPLALKRKCQFVAAFAAFQEAHAVCMSYLSDESSVLRCRESFERESVRKDDFIHEVQAWIKRTEVIRF